MDRQLRILIVEDEMTIALLIEDMVQDLGHEVAGLAMRLPQAMQQAATAEIDFAILDINLAHGETSAPLAERLNRSGIPFLVTSGSLPAPGKGIFGSARSLPKPVGARLLVAAVQEALG